MMKQLWSISRDVDGRLLAFYGGEGKRYEFIYTDTGKGKWLLIDTVNYKVVPIQLAIPFTESDITPQLVTLGYSAEDIQVISLHILAYFNEEEEFEEEEDEFE